MKILWSLEYIMYIVSWFCHQMLSLKFPLAFIVICKCNAIVLENYKWISNNQRKRSSNYGICENISKHYTLKHLWIFYSTSCFCTDLWLKNHYKYGFCLYRINCLAAVCLLQAWMMWNFINFHLRRMRERGAASRRLRSPKKTRSKGELKSGLRSKKTRSKGEWQSGLKENLI
jgi:hypothetical protein